MADFSGKTEGEVLTERKVQTKEPPMYRVILLNDNYTSMEFVVFILQTIFHKPPTEANDIMLSVHQKGSGTAGVYIKEIAETKIAMVQHLAKQHEYPLKCTLELA